MILNAIASIYWTNITLAFKVWGNKTMQTRLVVVKTNRMDIPSWFCIVPLLLRLMGHLVRFRRPHTSDSMSSPRAIDAAHRSRATMPMPSRQQSSASLLIHSSHLKVANEISCFSIRNSASLDEYNCRQFPIIICAFVRFRRIKLTDAGRMVGEIRVLSGLRSIPWLSYGFLLLFIMLNTAEVQTTRPTLPEDEITLSDCTSYVTANQSQNINADCGQRRFASEWNWDFLGSVAGCARWWAEFDDMFTRPRSRSAANVRKKKKM